MWLTAMQVLISQERCEEARVLAHDAVERFRRLLPEG
jgi:hypothetical protein